MTICLRQRQRPSRYARAAVFFSIVIISTTPAKAGPEERDSSLHAQSTIVSQQHPEFRSPYSGANSLNAAADTQTSLTWTVYAGYRLWHGGEFYVNPELAGGSGFSQTKGIAGFPNGEIYRVDDPSPKWNLARLFYKQVLGSGEQDAVSDDKNQIAGQQPVNRTAVIVGRFALNDYFDANSYSHDPRTQFLNWALMDNAAWDYAADTRGYSWGGMIEVNRANWAVRFASVMVPRQANQLEMETNFPQFHGNNLEFDYRAKLHERPSVTRLLIFENRANMGGYRSSLATAGGSPDISQFRSPSIKYGAGLNFEHEVRDDFGVFARVSWSDGHTESWAFTEVDLAASVGASLKGNRWHREHDVLGIAAIANGLSNDHRDYLSAGGSGFIVGDGRITYAPELIFESYYALPVMPGITFSADYQFVDNPAYNADRGPVSIGSIRLHADL